MLLNDITMNNKQADTKRRKLSINSRMISILLITVFIVACVFLMFIYEADFPNLSTSGAVAAIVSAAISVLLTASVTSELIKSQTDTEEIKERNIRIFEKKITIYQNFLEKLHEIISKKKISEDDVNELLFQISYVSMHAKPEHVKEVFGKLKESISLLTGDIDDQDRKKRVYRKQLAAELDNKELTVSDGYYNQLANSIFAVVKELRNDLYGRTDNLDSLGFDELMQKIDDAEERKGNLMLIGSDESKVLIESLSNRLKKKIEKKLKPSDGWDIFFTKACNWDFRIQHESWKKRNNVVGLFTEGISESEQFFFVMFNSDDFRNYYGLMRDIWGGKFSSKQWMLVVEDKYTNWKYSEEKLKNYTDEESSEDMLDYLAGELIKHAEYIRTLHIVYDIKEKIKEELNPKCYQWIFQNHCLVYEYLDEDICADMDYIDNTWRVMLYCRSGNTQPLADILPDIEFDGYRKVYYCGPIDDVETPMRKTKELVRKIEEYLNNQR